MSLADAVRAGLRELGELDPRDRACADLALLYAKRIDDTADGSFEEWGDKQRDPLAELGPKLLACLQQLGMTPAARKSVVSRETETVKPRSPLDELRAKRAERLAT